jgi:hypothetical protein
MPNHVTRLYATNAKIKQLWAETRISDPNSDRYLELGQQAGDDLIQARSDTLEEVLYKLSELQEWISEDGTASEKAMIASIIADIEALQEAPGGTPAPEPDLAPAPVPQGPAPKAGGAAAPVQTAQPVAPKIRVDRRSRPVHVDGKVYPSIIAAAQALGRSYESVRSETVRGRL